jgi:hypothetical protein
LAATSYRTVRALEYTCAKIIERKGNVGGHEKENGLYILGLIKKDLVKTNFNLPLILNTIRASVR